MDSSKGSARTRRAKAEKGRAQHGNNSRLALGASGNLPPFQVITSKEWWVSKGDEGSMS